MSDCRVQVEHDVTNGMMAVDITCRIDIDPRKLRRSDASYADLLYNELKMAFDKGWMDALTSVAGMVKRV